jgi:hypothetical protein
MLSVLRSRSGKGISLLDKINGNNSLDRNGTLWENSISEYPSYGEGWPIYISESAKEYSKIAPHL